jgi:hypothetical protein
MTVGQPTLPAPGTFGGQPAPWVTLREPAAGVPDAGPELLEAMYRALMVDDEWAVREERSFTWWPHRVPQTVTVSRPALAFGDPTVALRAACTVVEDVTADEDAVLHELSQRNATGMLSAWVWDPSARAIRVVTGAYLHPGNRPLLPVLQLAVLFVATFGQSEIDGLVASVGGRPATSPHPGSGRREEPDQLLGFVPGMVIPRGEGPSAFGGFVAEAASAWDWCMASGDDTDFTGELPFTGTTPAMVALAEGQDPTQTALVQISSDARHAALGSGLHAVLRLPAFMSRPEAEHLAQALNAAEATEPTGFPQFGAWCADPDLPTLTFVMFMPSLLARPGLVANAVFQLAMRCAWARERLGVAQR